MYLDGVVIASKNSTGTSVQITGLKPFQTYQVSSRGFTVVGPGPASKLTTFNTLQDVPLISPTLFIQATTSTSIELGWQPLTAEQSNGVVVQYCVTLSSSSMASSSRSCSPSTSTSMTITALQPGTKYLLSMEASTAVGPGPATQLNETTLDAGTQVLNLGTFSC